MARRPTKGSIAMAFSNSTFTCPVCKVPERAVGNPDETGETPGDQGLWFCFNCGSGGSYRLTFSVEHDAKGTRLAHGDDPGAPTHEVPRSQLDERLP